MAQGAYDGHRAVIEQVLRQARERLTPSQCDRIRHAVGERHREGKAMLVGAYAEDLGGRLIALLKDADEELSAEQVAELESLVERALPTDD